MDRECGGSSSRKSSALPDVWRKSCRKGRRRGSGQTALPISNSQDKGTSTPFSRSAGMSWRLTIRRTRSEEHTSELQSRLHLVCRLLLEKKKKKKKKKENTKNIKKKQHCRNIIQDIISKK